MALLFSGIQKYFIAGLFTMVFLLSAAAWGYRTTAQHEAAQRAQIEQQLRETVTAMDTLRNLHAANLEAIQRGSAEQNSLQEDRQNSRERIMIAPDEDYPVSPVLRDAVNGVR